MSFFFSKKTQRIERIEPFLEITQRIELFFVENMTQRIELFFSIWLKELLQPFFFMIQILGPFSHDSKNWTFLFTWLKYLNFFENFWFKEMDLFFFSRLKVFHQSKKTHRIKFLNPTHRIDFFLWIEPFNFLNMTQRFEPFFQNITQRFEFFDKTQRIELFDQYDSKN